MRRRLPASILVSGILLASALYAPPVEAAGIAAIPTTFGNFVTGALNSVAGFFASAPASVQSQPAAAAAGQGNITSPPIAALSSGSSSSSSGAGTPPASSTTASQTIINKDLTVSATGVTQAQLRESLGQLAAALTAGMAAQRTGAASASGYSDVGPTRINNLSFNHLTVNGVTGLAIADIPDLSASYLSTSGGTINGNLTITGSFNGAALSLANASTTLLSVFGPAYFGATATSTFGTDGSLTLAKALAVASGGTGTTTWQTGSIPFFNGSNLTEDNSNFFWDATNHRLGIGTTTPNNLLSLYSATKAAIGFNTNSGLSNWTIGQDASDGYKFKISSSTALGTNDRFVINGNGNVGIGTSSPSAQLVIDGTSGISATAWGLNGIALSVPGGTYTDTTSSGTVGDVAINAMNAPTIAATNPVTFTRASTLYLAAPIAGSNVTIGNAFALRIATGANATFGGFVGIGTTNPTQQLSISGNQSASSWTTTGIAFAVNNNLTYTDTSSAPGSTISNRSVSSFLTPKLAFSTGTSTISSASTLYINGAPTADASSTIITNPYAFFVNSGNVRLQSGSLIVSTSTTASSQLVKNLLTIINSSGGSSGTALADGITIQDIANGSSWDTTNPFGVLDFNSADVSTVGAGVRARIGTVMENAAGGLSSLALYTAPVTAGTMVERMRLTAAGNVGIGTTTPNWTTTMANATGPQLALTGTGANEWTLREAGGNLYFATSTYSATSSATALTIDKNGYLGIGTTSPWRTLDVNGTVGFKGLTNDTADSKTLCLTANNEVVSNSGSSCITSSQRFKNTIEPLDASSTLAEVMQLNPVSFQYNANIGIPGTQVGFIAEQVQTIDPRLVVLDASGTPFTVRYENLTAILAKAIQDIANVSGAFRDNLVAWLADATNGIHDLYASVLHANQLCLSDANGTTCYTRAQLNAVISGTNQPTGQGSAPAAPAISTSSAPSSASTTPDTASSTNPTTTPDTSTATTTPAAAPATPPPAPDATPTSDSAPAPNDTATTDSTPAPSSTPPAPAPTP